MNSKHTLQASAERITNAAPESTSTRPVYKSLGYFNLKGYGRAEVFHFRVFHILVVQIDTKVWYSKNSKFWSWQELFISDFCNDFSTLILNGHFVEGNRKEVFSC